jgi:hypothetical protein
MRRPVVTSALSVLLVSTVMAAEAAVLTVTDCGDTAPGGAPGQLRRLINDAAPGDVIDVPACLIVATGALGEDANAGGDFDIAKDLTIRGAGARRTIIQGASVPGVGGDRVFDVFAPAVVTLSDLMVRNGAGFQLGGGIRNAGTLTLDRVIVRASVAVGGDCATGDARGGGIGNTGTATLIESTVEQNVVNACLGSSGGGIWSQGTLTLVRSTVTGNTAFGLFSGSPGIVSDGTMSVLNSTISGNVGGKGGAGGIGSQGTLTVIGSAIVGNGSGIATVNGVAASGTATLTNTIVADNANNFSGGQQFQCTGVTSGGGNLATDDSCGSAAGDAVAAGVGLGALSEQGGPTATHPVLPASPAIDTALSVPCGTEADQRGMPRPQDGNGDGTAVCDKGPVELTPILFADVVAGHFARGAIEALRVNGLTGGCGVAPLVFCPDDPLTRAQLAVFLLRVLLGAGFTPPPATGVFADVPASHPFAPWIEELSRRGITGGCGTSPLIYCPEDPVTRGQMAVLILRVLAVLGFVPPAPTGLFEDVPTTHPFAPSIEEIARRGVTGGCQQSPARYCPADPLTRAQLAVFLVRGFGLGF